MEGVVSKLALPKKVFYGTSHKVKVLLVGSSVYKLALPKKVLYGTSHKVKVLLVGTWVMIIRCPHHDAHTSRAWQAKAVIACT